MENREVYQIEKGVREVIITHRKALDELRPAKINIEGNIDSVCNWLEKRVVNGDIVNGKDNMVWQKTSHLIINRDIMRMEFVFNETDQLHISRVVGQLTKHSDFEKWQINTGEGWDHKELSEFIKMNRSDFKAKSNAMKLSASLADVKIKADNEYEKSNDNRGNVRALISQKIIESNIPKTFKLNVPVFKGTNPTEIEVEVYVNPNNYSVTLVSPEANDVVSEIKNQIIDSEKERIQMIAPDLVIIEQ